MPVQLPYADPMVWATRGTVIFIIFGKASPDALLGFGLGGTLIALFMRVARYLHESR